MNGRRAGFREQPSLRVPGNLSGFGEGPSKRALLRLARRAHLPARQDAVVLARPRRCSLSSRWPDALATGRRPTETSAGATSAPAPPPDSTSTVEEPDKIGIEQVAGGFESPVQATSAPGDSTRIYVVEQTGRIMVVENGQTREQPFVDLSDRIVAGGEQGLLSVAFHPDYAANGRAFVNYTNTRRRHARGRADGRAGDGGRRSGDGEGAPRGRAAGLEPQRRPARLRARRAPLRGHGRRRRRRRSERERPEHGGPARQAPQPRHGRLGRDVADAGVRPAQPVALLLRPRDRRALHRRRRPGRLGGDRRGRLARRRTSSTSAGTSSRERTSTPAASRIPRAGS